MEQTALLRSIPKVDELLKGIEQAENVECVHRTVLAEAAREVTEGLRREILAGDRSELPAKEIIARMAVERAFLKARPHLHGMINAAGVILHTNLGRAVMSAEAARAAYEAASGYSTLEYDPEKGCRGTRYSHVEPLLTRLTGAESALVVNNNAAAVLLMLTALTAGGEVIISRGELVEIGGSFRVPDIMESCGAVLKEVGTTNKTHLSDYEKAIGPDTRALMKVHTSNYRIIGFTECVSREEMVELGHAKGLPVFEDLGSGCFADLNAFGIHGEPTVQASVRSGMDVVTFSGDKLLGGPQAGILVGKKKYIDILKKHPLTRALRVDKMTLAALEATLRAYTEERSETVPTVGMLALTQEQLLGRAEELKRLLEEKGIRARILSAEDEVGGGSVPMQELPSYAVAVEPEGRNSVQLEAAFRAKDIIGRIEKDTFLLHVRTLLPGQAEIIARAAEEIVK